MALFPDVDVLPIGRIAPARGECSLLGADRAEVATEERQRDEEDQQAVHGMERSNARVLEISQRELHLEQHDQQDRVDDVDVVTCAPVQQRKQEYERREPAEDVAEGPVRREARRAERAPSREVELDEDSDQERADGDEADPLNERRSIGVRGVASRTLRHVPLSMSQQMLDAFVSA
jgi:hypothetical protein